MEEGGGRVIGQMALELALENVNGISGQREDGVEAIPEKGSSIDKGI